MSIDVMRIGDKSARSRRQAERDACPPPHHPRPPTPKKENMYARPLRVVIVLYFSRKFRGGGRN